MKVALHGKRVLAIDWDLEAPGLHRYLSPFLDDPELSESDGILDFVIRLAESAALEEASSEDLTAEYFEQRADILSYVKPLEFEDFPGEGCLHLIGAGRQDASYSRRLSLFNFVQFYERLNGRRYLEATKKWMRAEYDYRRARNCESVALAAAGCWSRPPKCDRADRSAISRGPANGDGLDVMSFSSSSM